MIELSDDERLNRAMRSVRNYIRDKTQLNRLLLGNHETSDEELKQCVVHALIDWNNTPPPIGNVSLANHPNKPLLVIGAAIQALIGAGIWHSREHMISADGGTSADDHNKAGEYSAWIERLTNDYERKKIDLKISLNIQAALSGMGVRSEYSYYYVYGEQW